MGYHAIGDAVRSTCKLKTVQKKDQGHACLYCTTMIPIMANDARPMQACMQGGEHHRMLLRPPLLVGSLCSGSLVGAPSNYACADVKAMPGCICMHAVVTNTHHAEAAACDSERASAGTHASCLLHGHAQAFVCSHLWIRAFKPKPSACAHKHAMRRRLHTKRVHG